MTANIAFPPNLILIIILIKLSSAILNDFYVSKNSIDKLKVKQNIH